MRKVVLATNIAETSLTIEGIRLVVDCAQERVARFDPVSYTHLLIWLGSALSSPVSNQF